MCQAHSKGLVAMSYFIIIIITTIIIIMMITSSAVFLFIILTIIVKNRGEGTPQSQLYQEKPGP